MFGKWMELLCKELAIDSPKIRPGKPVPLRLGAYAIELRELEVGVSFSAPIGPIPKKREDAFTYCLRANLLGQGTGGARIGLSANERILTLSLGLPYELDYQMFKDAVENFVNYLIHWQKEMGKFE